MALNRHFRRHFVLFCTRNSAISRDGYHTLRTIAPFFGTPTAASARYRRGPRSGSSRFLDPTTGSKGRIARRLIQPFQTPRL
jgi:hypothetical protein